MGRNSEAYVDDIVVKTHEEHTLLSGNLLDFLVSPRGIEANPYKIKAIEEMQPPRRLKDMQRLVGCMASLGRFISKFGKKAMPCFKIMKRSGTFKWTPEADKAFEDLKKYPASHPLWLHHDRMSP